MALLQRQDYTTWALRQLWQARDRVGGYLLLTNQLVHESEQVIVRAPGSAPYLVNLSSRICSCTDIQQSRIPCTHAMAFLGNGIARQWHFFIQKESGQIPLSLQVFSFEKLCISYSINIRPAVIEISLSRCPDPPLAQGSDSSDVVAAGPQ